MGKLCFSFSLLGSIAQWSAYSLPDPAAQGSNFSIPPKNSKELLSMLLRLINGSAQRKVDSGLKMFIEPIQNWLVASQYFKKFCFSARLSCLPKQPKFLGLLRPPNEVAQPQRHQSRNMELSVNNNNNSNYSKDGIGYYAKGDVERYTGLFFCSVVACLTLGGNLLVIVAFVTRPALRKVRSNVFILSLGKISVCLFLKSAISGHSFPLRQL